MPIDKELVKQVVNAKKPRNFMYVEGTDDNVLLVSKSKIEGDELKAAEAKAKGKATKKGKIQLEATGNGQSTVVFFMAKADQTYVAKFRRTLKEQAGLSKAVEVRKFAEEQPQDGNGAGDPSLAKKPDTVRGPLETAYRRLRMDLREEMEALKTLNPKAVAVVQKKLSDAEAALGKESAGDERFKPGIKLLKSLKATVDKLPRKGGDAALATSDRAAYKSLRERLTVLSIRVNKVDAAVAGQAARILMQADGFIADSLPEEKRDYKKGMKTLLEAKKILLAKVKNLEQQNTPLEKVKQEELPNVKFKVAYKRAKELFENFSQAVPQAPELQKWKLVMGQAGELARKFNFGTATQQIEGMANEIDGMRVKHEQANRTLDVTRSVLADAQKLKLPRLSGSILKTFADYMGGAESMMRKNRIDDALAGVKGLDVRIRKAIDERKMFADSAQSIDKLLDEASASLKAEVVQDFENRFQTTYVDFEGGDITGAYDKVTKIEAELQRALRMVPQRQKPSTSPNVDSSAQAPLIKEGISQRSRELKFKLNADGVRRSFGLLKEKWPESLSIFEQWLSEVLKEQKTDFDEAEYGLEQLVDEVNEGLKLIRSGMPLKDKYPPRRPNRPAPQPPRESLVEWKKGIDPKKLSFDPGKKLGAGGQGAIYQLASTDGNAPPLVVKFSDVNEDEASEELQLEAKNYELVGDHPNIIRSFGMAKVGGKEGLVLEQVKGTGFDNVTNNLKTRLAKGEITQPEFWGSVQYTIGKTLEVLDFLHDKGLADNDVKPENIMIDQTTGDVKVIDLGTVNRLSEDPGETSPVYRAPEAGKGSSPQTDVFSTGASLFEAGEGETFAYNEKQKMAETTFRSTIAKIVEQYGDLKDDDEANEMAIKQQNQINAPEETVDEKGNPDPTGTQRKKNAGVSANKSAYTEFVNWLLHPDPKKRPTAKQALRHPFLRDRILDEDKVKSLLKSTGEAPPEQQGKEPMRKLADDGVTGMTEHRNVLQLATDLIAKFKTAGLSRPDLLKLRVEIDQHMNSAKIVRRRVGNGIRGLEDIVKKAVIRNSPEFYKDQGNLVEMKKFADDWVKIEPRLRRAMSAVDYKLSPEGSKPSDVPTDQDITVEQARQRLGQLTAERNKIASDFKTALAKKSDPGFERLQNIEGFLMQVEAAKSRNDGEKQLLVKLLNRVKGVPNQANDAVAVGREFQAHLQELDKLSNDISSAISQIESEINDLEWDVGNIETDTTELLELLAGVAKEVKQKGLAFEAEAKKPRNTQEEMARFEKVRTEFENAEQNRRDLEVRVRSQAEHYIQRARELAVKIGPLAPKGQANLPDQLAAVETKLREALVNLAK